MVEEVIIAETEDDLLPFALERYLAIFITDIERKTLNPLLTFFKSCFRNIKSKNSFPVNFHGKVTPLQRTWFYGQKFTPGFLTGGSLRNKEIGKCTGPFTI